MLNTFSVKEWLQASEGKIFRYLVYKKMFTPYEQQEAFEDEDQFEDNYYNFAVIECAVELGNGKWLLGLRQIVDHELSNHVEYLQLGDIRLEYFEDDQKILEEVEYKSGEEFSVGSFDEDG